MVRQIAGCGECHGRGKIVKKACKDCQGKGTVDSTKQLKVDIPAGADTGYSVKVVGEGEAAVGGVPGDLYIVVNVELHPLFETHGDDLYIQHDISFVTAALGGQVQVPGLGGDIRVKVDVGEGTQTGAVTRVPGPGMPRLGKRGKGDQYVVLRVVTPTNLGREEKELPRQFQRLREESDGRRHGKDRKG